eukprot:2890871-Pleurochrysis_carterae.AAC.1
MADDPSPNGSLKSLPNQKRDRRGNYVLIETLEETGMGRAPCIKDKDGMEGGGDCAQTWYGHGRHT